MLQEKSLNVLTQQNDQKLVEKPKNVNSFYIESKVFEQKENKNPEHDQHQNPDDKKRLEQNKTLSNLDNSQQSKTNLKSTSSQNNKDLQQEEEQEEQIFDMNNVDIFSYVKIIQDIINQKRAKKQLPLFFEDISLNMIANEFVNNFWLCINQSNKLNNILTKYKFDSKFQRIVSKYEFLDYEDDLNETLLDSSITDSLNVICENKTDNEILFNKDFNSFGIGFSIQEEYICIVILVTYLPIQITKIRKNQIDQLEISGKVHDGNKGLYAVRLSQVDQTKEKSVMNYQHIKYHFEDNSFIVCYDFDEDFQEPLKMLEFFLKEDPQSIKYGQSCRIKHISKSYDVNLRIPLCIFPIAHSYQKKFLIQTQKSLLKSFEENLEQQQAVEDQQDIQSDQQTLSQESSMQSSLKKESEPIVGININYDDTEQNGSMNEFYFGDPEVDEQEEQMQSQENSETDRNDNDLKLELEKAINEAVYEMKKQVLINKKLQLKLQRIWPKTGIKIYTSLNNNNGMNEIKYNNSLALIHQINQEMNKIKEKYNLTADELNERLEEKNKNFQQIKQTFMNLKKEISQKAAFMTNLKRIPLKMLEQLQNEEDLQARGYQNMRIEMIKLRMKLDKKKKIINKKDQFADGLHLIDFEKLKIENQSLNEKIEQRNEEIFKLKKKNFSNVQILSHIKEKLYFENDEFKTFSENYELLSQKYRAKKKELPGLEKDLINEQKKMVKLTQETGIVKNKFLKLDFIKRKKNIEKLEIEKNQLDVSQKAETLEKIGCYQKG